MQELKHILKQEISRNKTHIQKEISIFNDLKLQYANIEINKNIQLVLRNKGSEKLMMIGFPFPLESYPLEGFQANNETLIFIFLRGSFVRNYQRKLLLNELTKLRKVNYEEITPLQKFRKLTELLCNKFKKTNYYDPYSFLGDSYIGLHFIENFEKTFNLKINRIYSENYKDLLTSAPVKGYIGTVTANNNTLNIFSDLIDTQWNRTKHILKCLTKQNSPSIICGRDLIIIPDKNAINIYHFKREDVLLKKENIEDYMNNCLLPFLNPKTNSFYAQNKKSKNIIINPFGSEQIKTIPQKIILDTSAHFKKHYPQSKLLLIAGFNNSYSHMLWISKLKGALSDQNLDNIIFKNYGSFEEIKKDIERYDCSMGLTADTSVAHLFNFLGLKNITFFNLTRCDLNSPQSLSSDSPLGFCRYGNVQYPAILHGDDQNKLINGVLQAIDYFLGKNKTLSWCNLIFNDFILISKIDKTNRDLIKANKKLNPRYKLND